MTHAPWTPEAQGATGTLAALREVWGPHFLLSCPPPHRRGRRANWQGVPDPSQGGTGFHLPVGNPPVKLQSFLRKGRARRALRDPLSRERQEGRPPTSPTPRRRAGRLRRVSEAPIPRGTAPVETAGSGGRRCSLLPPLARRLELSHTCFPRQPPPSSICAPASHTFPRAFLPCFLSPFLSSGKIGVVPLRPSTSIGHTHTSWT